MFILKQSSIDPKFFEIKEGNKVWEEVKILFPLKRFPSSFSSLEEVKTWLEKEEKKRAKSYALYLLNRKGYCSKQLLDKLSKKGFSFFVGKELIQRFTELGYLNDEDFYSLAIEREFQKGKGPRFIALKLQIPLEKVREKISFEREREKIVSFTKKEKLTKKLMGKFLRRGFDVQILQRELSY